MLEGHAGVAGADGAVVGHGLAVDFEEHVALLQDAVARAAGGDEVDHDAAARLGQTALPPIGGGEQGKGGEPRIGEAVVLPVEQVPQEVVHHRDGDEEAHVVEAGVALEGHPHHPAVLHHGAAAVAGIDGGVGLHHQVRIDAAVDVAARLDPRDDARGGGDLLAAQGEAVGQDMRARARQLAEVERPQTLHEGGVFHGEHGEVAVVGHRGHARDVGVRLVVAAHQHLPRVGHHVGVGHDAAARDEEAAAQARLHRLLAPGQAPVETRAVDLDEHDGVGYGVGAGGKGAGEDRCRLRRGRRGACLSRGRRGAGHERDEEEGDEGCALHLGRIARASLAAKSACLSRCP